MNEEPLVSVVRGSVSAEELAALIGVLTSRSSQVSATSPTAVSTDGSAWVRSGRPGTRFRPGVGAWRASGLPH
jgi:hypothetical protein